MRYREFSEKYLAPSYYGIVWLKWILAVAAAIAALSAWPPALNFAKRILLYLALYIYNINEYINNFSIIWFYASTAIILIFLISIPIKQNRVGKRIKKVLDSYHQSYEGHAECRNDLTKILLKSKISKNEYELSQNIIKNDLESLCDRVSDSFESLTGKKCHASIKLYNQKSKKITTGARSRSGDGFRRALTEQKLRSYPYTDNTAFAIILDDNNESAYRNNHLLLSSIFGFYKNIRENWSDQYRSVVVIPLTKNRHPKAINSRSVVGFLCIDSRKGRFPKRSKHILRLYGILCHEAMQLSNAVEQIPKRGA